MLSRHSLSLLFVAFFLTFNFQIGQADEPVTTPEFRNFLQFSDSLAGWQADKADAFTRNNQQLSVTGNSTTLKFDFPQTKATWSFNLTTPAKFTGSAIAVVQSKSKTWEFNLLADKTACCSSEGEGSSEPISVAHQITLSNSQLNWTVAGTQLNSLNRSSTEPLWLSLKLTAAANETISVSNLEVKEQGYTSLFNGTDLTGWEGSSQPAEVCWKVEEGAIVCSGKHKGPWLRSLNEYDDFNLRIEYWLSEEGNTGLFVRVPKDGNHHRKSADLPTAGFEIQLLDDFAEVYKKMNLKDYQYTGSIYDIVGANQHVGHGPKKWNTLELNCHGQHITTIHNGIKIVDATAKQYPLLSLRKVKGYLGLQNHSTVVKFRNLRIGPAIQY